MTSNLRIRSIASFIFSVVLTVGTAPLATAQPALVWTAAYAAAERAFGEGNLLGDPVLLDFDGDTVPDPVVSVVVAGETVVEGRIVILSGIDGEPLALPPINAVSPLPTPDLTGDGVPDLWVRAFAGGADFLELHSGAALLSGGASRVATASQPGGGSGGVFGAWKTGGLDATGDGAADLVLLHAGRVWLYSGAALASGATTAVRSFAPPDAEALFSPSRNSQLALVPDLDGDGAADLLVSDPAFEPPGPDPNAGVVYAFSGATGALLHRWLRTGSEQGRIALAFGSYGLAAIGGPPGSGPGAGPDLDGDDVPDVLIGSQDFTEPLSILGGVHAYSGATGARIRRYDMPEPTWFAQFGTNLRAVPDGDGDGMADLATAVGFNGPEPEQYGPRGVLVVSTATGGEIARVVDPDESGTGFGRSYLASVVGGDGRTRLFVSAPIADVEGQTDAGAVYAFALLPVAAEPAVSASSLSVTVAPNPARSSATLALSLGAAASVRVAIVDALGRVVRRLDAGALAAGAHRLALGVDGLPAGIYVVRVTAGERVVSARLVVGR